MDTIYYFFRTILPFEWTNYEFMINAFLGILIITPLFGMIGTTIVNNKMSFFSDALGHSALTGIAIGVMLGIDNYMISMLGFALVFALGISAVLEKGNSSSDTVIGVFSAVGLALGIVILSAKGGFAKYSSYLIGDILTVQPDEILMIFIILLIVLLIWIFFYNKLLLVSLNADMASGKNINVTLIKKMFAIIIAVVVTVSIKWIGIMIINSLLVLPAAAARNLTKSVRSSHLCGVLISMFSGICGLMVSFYTGAAASGTIVLIAALIFFLSFIYNGMKARR